MVNPVALSFGSPFSCFKNFDRSVLTITVSGAVPAGEFAHFSSTALLDRTSAVKTMQFKSSVNSVFHNNSDTYLYTPYTLITHNNGATATFPTTAAYSITFENDYSPSGVTVKAVVFNTNAETLTVVSETFTLKLYTFVAPWA